MKGIFTVLVENKDGVLSSIAGLFARRGFNIDSLAVGETDNRAISSMTIVSTGDQRTIDQIEKQLNKKVDVIKVRRLNEAKSVSLEMMLVKVSCTAATRSAIIELCQITGAKMYDPSVQAVAVCGDGSFQMSMNELATIRVNQVPVKVLVMRNRYLGLVREYQYNTYDSHDEGVLLHDWPRYDKIAEAYEMPFFTCARDEDLEETLDKFLACPDACLMVCEVDSEDRVK